MNTTADIQAAVMPPEPVNEILDLKATREAMGFSLSDVFHATRVSVLNLEALERWDFDRLPPPVYTRNFIRKYAQAIGIDEEPILNRYQIHLDSAKAPSEEKENKRSRPGRRYYFILLGILAIATVAGVFLYPLNPRDQLSNPFLPARSGEPPPPLEPSLPLEPSALSQTKPLQESPPVVATSITAKLEIPRTEERASLPLPVHAAPKTLHLVIEAKELTWARITEDNGSPSQVLLKPGERIERRASDFFLLDVGNAGGIDLTLQGKPLGSIGKRGQVVHIRLPDRERDRTAP